MDDDYMYGQEEAEEEDDQDSEDEPKKGVAKTVEKNLYNLLNMFGSK